MRDAFMWVLLVPVALLGFRGMMTNWEQQSAWFKYQNREKGLRHLFWPAVLVDKDYYRDKPELLELRRKSLSHLFQVVIAAAIWLAIGVVVGFF